MRFSDAPPVRGTHRVTLRLAACVVPLVAALLTLMAVAAPRASAHVEIDTAGAMTNGYAVLRFIVPNEASSSPTVRVEIDLPTSVDIPYVWVRAPHGWRAKLDRRELRAPLRSERGDITEVVSKVTFEGGEIAPGQFEVFDIRLGPLPPEAGEVLTFPTLQFFGDGSSERWVDPVDASGPEPDHPVPMVVVRNAGSETGGGSEGGAQSAVHVVLGSLGVALGSAGVGLGAVALARSRRR